VFGASIMNFVINMRKRHPDLDRPLIGSASPSPLPHRAQRAGLHPVDLPSGGSACPDLAPWASISGAFTTARCIHTRVSTDCQLTRAAAADYDTALVLEVTTLLGTLIGVDINKVDAPPLQMARAPQRACRIRQLARNGIKLLCRSSRVPPGSLSPRAPPQVSPVWFITLLMILTLGFTTYRTALKVPPSRPSPRTNRTRLVLPLY
jgi:hypothetical protein